VLIDDVVLQAQQVNTGSGVSKGSMLRPKHCLQPLALLDHSSGPTDRDFSIALFGPNEAFRLAQIDALLLHVLDIPKTSDSKRFKLNTAIGGKPEPMIEASQRLEAVLLLLQSLRGTNTMSNSSSSSASSSRDRLISHAPPLVKHTSITLHFTAPNMVQAERIPCNAVWGVAAAGGVGGGKPLLLAGDPEDYNAELEELVTALLGMSSGGGAQGWPVKALHLLRFLENEEKFLRFLRRDFPAFCPSDAPSLKDEAKKKLKRKADVLTGGGDGGGSGGEKEEGLCEDSEMLEEEEGEEEEEVEEKVHVSLQNIIARLNNVKKERERDRERQLEEEREKQRLKSERKKGKKGKRGGGGEGDEDSSIYGDYSSEQPEGGKQAAALADAFLNSIASSLPSSMANMQALGGGGGGGGGGGRGRGATLPAWLTAGGGEVAALSERVSSLGGGITVTAAADLSSGGGGGGGGFDTSRGGGEGMGDGVKHEPLKVEEQQAEEVPSSALDGLGDWEKHTRGIGKKLLAKFGFSSDDIGRGPMEVSLRPNKLGLGAEKGKTGKGRGKTGAYSTMQLQLSKIHETESTHKLTRNTNYLFAHHNNVATLPAWMESEQAVAKAKALAQEEEAKKRSNSVAGSASSEQFEDAALEEGEGGGGGEKKRARAEGGGAFVPPPLEKSAKAAVAAAPAEIELGKRKDRSEGESGVANQGEYKAEHEMEEEEEEEEDEAMNDAPRNKETAMRSLILKLSTFQGELTRCIAEGEITLQEAASLLIEAAKSLKGEEDNEGEDESEEEGDEVVVGGGK